MDLCHLGRGKRSRPLNTISLLIRGPLWPIGFYGDLFHHTGNNRNLGVEDHWFCPVGVSFFIIVHVATRRQFSEGEDLEVDCESHLEQKQSVGVFHLIQRL
jgi:hypothetical protein